MKLLRNCHVCAWAGLPAPRSAGETGGAALMPIGFVGRGVGPPQPDAGAYRVVSLDLRGTPDHAGRLSRNRVGVETCLNLYGGCIQVGLMLCRGEGRGARGL